MSANISTTNAFDQPEFEYDQRPWGDLIYGTKDQLQSIGIAVGMAFPGETDGPKRSMKVVDPRGFPACIVSSDWKMKGTYSVSISFPGREKQEQWDEYAPGIRKGRCGDWGDEYTGTAEALAAAGLISLDQLPGQPGMRKVRVTILPDGTLPKGGITSEARAPGAKTIERASRTTYSVKVRVPEEEECRRYEENQRADTEWEARMRALPRPAPLIPLPGDRRPVQKAPAFRKDRAEGNVIYITPVARGQST